MRGAVLHGFRAPNPWEDSVWAIAWLLQVLGNFAKGRFGAHMETVLLWWVLMNLDHCPKQNFEVSVLAELTLAFRVYPELLFWILFIISASWILTSLCFLLPLPLLIVRQLKRWERELEFCVGWEVCCIIWGSLTQWIAIRPAAECVRSATDCRLQDNDKYLSELFATTCWATDLLLKVLHIYNILKKIIEQNTWLSPETCYCPAAIKINASEGILESCLVLLILFCSLFYSCCNFLCISIRYGFNVRSLLQVLLPRCPCNVSTGELLWAKSMCVHMSLCVDA